MVDALRQGRVARVVRILRVLRVVKASRMLTLALLTQRRASAIRAAVFVSIWALNGGNKGGCESPLIGSKLRRQGAVL